MRNQWMGGRKHHRRGMLDVVILYEMQRLIVRILSNPYTMFCVDHIHGWINKFLHNLCIKRTTGSKLFRTGAFFITSPTKFNIAPRLSVTGDFPVYLLPASNNLNHWPTRERGSKWVGQTDSWMCEETASEHVVEVVPLLELLIKQFW